MPTQKRTSATRIYQRMLSRTVGNGPTSRPRVANTVKRDSDWAMKTNHYHDEDDEYPCRASPPFVAVLIEPYILDHPSTDDGGGSTPAPAKLPPTPTIESDSEISFLDLNGAPQPDDLEVPQDLVPKDRRAKKKHLFNTCIEFMKAHFRSTKKKRRVSI